MVARAGSRGIALLAVVWITSVMAVLATHLGSASRTDQLLVRNLVTSMRAELLADAGVHVALARLAREEPEDRWRADGRPYAFTLDGVAITVSVTDEDGRIDLNQAPAELLEGLLRGAGLEPREAAVMRARIEDWRDEDDEPRPGGAETKEYERAGLPAPRNRPFLRTSELRRVLGVSGRLYARIAPSLTVLNQSEVVDPMLASPDVLLAAPGMDADLAEAIMSGRAAAPFEFDPYEIVPDELIDYLGESRERFYRIRSEARLADGSVFVREAILELTWDTESPYRTLQWNRPPVMQ